MSDSLYILSIVAATSCAAYAVGRRRGLRAALFPPALLRGIRYVGVCLLFWIGNIAVGAGVALLVRGLGLGFIWLYVNTDVSVLVLSALQALVFESWRLQHEQERAASAARMDAPPGCPAAPGLTHEPPRGARE